jgi:hypothetical protein
MYIVSLATNPHEQEKPRTLYDIHAEPSDVAKYLKERPDMTDIMSAFARVKSERVAALLYEALVGHKDFAENPSCIQRLVAVACSDKTVALSAIKLLTGWRSVHYELYQRIQSTSPFENIKRIAEGKRQYALRVQTSKCALEPSVWTKAKSKNGKDGEKKLKTKSP